MKRNFSLKSTPNYYTVRDNILVETVSRPMYKVKITITIFTKKLLIIIFYISRFFGRLLIYYWFLPFFSNIFNIYIILCTTKPEKNGRVVLVPCKQRLVQCTLLYSIVYWTSHFLHGTSNTLSRITSTAAHSEVKTRRGFIITRT